MMALSYQTERSGTKALLTARELEILDLLSEGKSSKEIARQVVVSKRTVDACLGKIYQKLKVSNRVEAVRRALELRLVSF